MLYAPEYFSGGSASGTERRLSPPNLNLNPGGCSNFGAWSSAIENSRIRESRLPFLLHLTQLVHGFLILSQLEKFGIILRSSPEEFPQQRQGVQKLLPPEFERS